MVDQIKTYTTEDDFLFSDWNTEMANIYAALNAFGTSAIPLASITEIKLANNANPAVYFAELFQDGVVLGTSSFTFISKTGLDVTISAGTAYVLQTSTTPDKLLRIDIAKTQTLTVLDNTTNFLDLGSDGVVDVVQSSTAAEDHTRLMEVVAAGAVITTNTDLADRDFLGDTISDNIPKQVDWSCNSANEVVILENTRFRDTTNTKTFEFASDQTIDIEAAGANGLDQGSEASSSWYALVGIGDSSGVLPTTGMFVVASDYDGSIALPAGYDLYKRIGWVFNDGGSDFLQGQYYDNQFWFEEEVVVLANGSTTSFSAIDCTSGMPPTTKTGIFRVEGNASGSFTVHARPTGSGATTGIKTNSVDTAAYQVFLRTDTSQSIDYIAVGSGLAIDFNVVGYIDTLEKDS